MKIVRIVAITLCMIFSLGCVKEFEPYWLVNKPRVFAIQSANPEVRPNEVAQLRAFYDAPADAEISWEWCLLRTSARDYFECPTTQEDLNTLLADQLPPGITAETLGIIPFDLGTGDTVDFKYPAPQPIIQALCTGLQQALADAPPELAAALPEYNCDESYEVSIRARMKSGDSEIFASKRVNLWLGSDQPQDLNPTITAIEIKVNEEADVTFLKGIGHDWATTEWTEVPDDVQLPVAAGVSYEIRTLIDEASLDRYQRRAPDGADTEFLPEELESAEFRWFTDAGSVAGGTGLFFEDVLPIEEAGESGFNVPTDAQEGRFDGATFVANCVGIDDGNATTGCEVRVWSVVRDGRLGVASTSRTFLAAGVKR